MTTTAEDGTITTGVANTASRQDQLVARCSERSRSPQTAVCINGRAHSGAGAKKSGVDATVAGGHQKSDQDQRQTGGDERGTEKMFEKSQP